MRGQTKSKDFREILELVWQKIVHKSFTQTDQNLPKNSFLPTTDKYSAVFTEYSVAEYSAGHYSAEYLADRIVGRSLEVPMLKMSEMYLMLAPPNLKFSRNYHFQQSRVSIPQHVKKGTNERDLIEIPNCHFAMFIL
jgi:uncharacterized protein YjaG (DUF416 family)